MKIIITDTNILIDLIQSQLLDLFFGLPLEIHTLDLAIEELKKPEQREAVEAFIASGKLNVMEVSGEEINESVHLQTSHALKGITDKAMIVKALKNECALISGDGNLRKSALDKGLQVHGILWIVRQIMANNLCDKEELLTLTERLQQSNARLPKAEMEKLIHEIKST